MTLTVRRALAATTATAALFALAGCGGGDDSGEAAEKTTTSASAETSDEPADESEPAETEDFGGETLSGEEFAALLKGALDEATTAHLTMDLGGLGSGEGDVDYSTNPPELAMNLAIEQLGGEVEVRIVDATMYLKSPALGAGDGWVSIPLDDPSGPLGDLGSQINPTQQFEAFGNAVTEATLVGEEDVDGETLDHYTATVDTAKLLAESPQAAGGGAGLPDTLTQDWWFDDDGLIRRFSGDFGSTTGAVDIKLDEWGEDVAIEAPPADEVTPMGGGAAQG